MPIDELRLSPSLLRDFLLCPRYVEFKYIMKIPSVIFHEPFLGLAYHKALAECFRWKLATGRFPPRSTILDMFSEAWEKKEALVFDEPEEPASDLKIEWEGENPQQLKDEGGILLLTYAKEVAPTVKPMLVEHWLEKREPTVSFVCRLDLETTSGEVIDHKVMRHRLNEDEAKRHIQPLFIAHIKDRPLLFTFHVAVRKTYPEIQKISIEKRQGEIDWFRFRFLPSIEKAFRSGVFYPNPSWKCKRCEYKQLC